MRVRSSVKCLCLAALIVAPVRGRDIRVELFSGKKIAALIFQAGRSPVRICDPLSLSRCLEVKPGAQADCAAQRKSVCCTSGVEAREFRTASFLAPEPFQLTVAGGSEGTEPAAVLLRRAEVAPAPRGLRVVASLGLEDYVAGVLAGEAATLRNPEALAAMAVMARTWAERSRGRHRMEGFDFCSLTHCQFFRLPNDEENASMPAIEAARRTAGQVLEFRGKLIDAYYSACCGGVTEAAGEVWPDRRAPYLKSLRDPYCARSEHSHWRQTLALGDIERVLREAGGKSFGGSLDDVAIASRTVSGRARTLQLIGSSTRTMDANEFRYTLNRALGWNTLKSSLFTVERRGNSLVFTGRGLGHGVGLCQAGAEQMGQMGIGFERILAFYFPGTELGGQGSSEDSRFLSSEHFEMVFPSRQERLAATSLEILEEQRARLGARVEALPTRIRVRTWQTTEDFIQATRQPGWVAGSNDGRVIDLQPLDLLKRKGILESTLRHELTHLVVRRLRAPGVPQWYEEGLVLFLTGEPVPGESRKLDKHRSLEASLTQPRSEAEMRAAYAAAFACVRELARQMGEAALWQVLERPSAQDVQWFKSRP